MTSTIAGNLDAVDQQLRRACERAGRRRETVTLVAVTKFQSPDRIQALAAAGAAYFAESRVQEAKTKVPGLKSLGTWHFIGHLQTNKAAMAAELMDVIQSVDSLRLAQKLDEAARVLGKTLPVFAQVNISGEAQKHGFSLDEAPDLIGALAALPQLRLQGLMGMAPLEGGPDAARPAFAALRALRERLKPSLGPLALSMGMSQDFEVAIEEGADMVRIGSALFKGLPPLTGTATP
jgi:pyridoxal phosphate enzyme (YggS family)